MVTTDSSDFHPSEPGVSPNLPVLKADLETGKTDTTIHDLGSIMVIDTMVGIDPLKQYTTSSTYAWEHREEP